MRWQHRLLDHCDQFLSYLLQFHLIAQGGTESGKRPGCVILASIKATINEDLDASSQWLEERCNHEGRADNQERVLPCLPIQRGTNLPLGKREKSSVISTPPRKFRHARGSVQSGNTCAREDGDWRKRSPGRWP